MSEEVNFLSTWQIWVILGIVLCLLEILGSGFFLLSLGVSCFLAAVASLVLGVKGQIVVFLLGAIVIFFASRRLIYGRRIYQPDDFGLDRMIGKEGVAEEPITEQGGYVKIGGESWPAKPADGKPIAGGAKIIVKAIEGNKALVEQNHFRTEQTKGD